MPDRQPHWRLRVAKNELAHDLKLKGFRLERLMLVLHPSRGDFVFVWDDDPEKTNHRIDTAFLMTMQAAGHLIEVEDDF